MKKLNVGCGDRFLEDWENIDFVSKSEHVRQHDLTKGLPYSDGEFDVVYSSHVIEHLSLAELDRFLQECYRVLRPNGVLRLVFPDLEEIARNYLHCLGNLRHEASQLNRLKYDWAKIELIDQMTRQRSGGEYIAFIRTHGEENWSWLQDRVGFEAKPSSGNHSLSASARRPSLQLKLARRLRTIAHKVATLLLHDPDAIRKYETGSFVLSGELHKWMHDEASISHVLCQAGFNDPKKCSASRSSISTWTRDQWLDAEGGKTRKPDSMFIEATK